MLFGALSLPTTMQIVHLFNGHMDEHFLYGNDLNVQSDDKSCLFEYTFNNQLSDLNKIYSSETSLEFFSEIVVNEIIFYSKNYFCLSDERGPPIA